MRNSQLLLYGVGLATLGVVVAAPVNAAQADSNQGQNATASSAAQASPDQQAEIDSWPAEMQTAYAAWPPETQSYYWTLIPERQAIFWRLRDQHKITLTSMTGPERDATWQQIEQAVADMDS